jgi:hypothetical protein
MTFFYPVKLIAAVLYPDEELWNWTINALSILWGPPEDASEAFLFAVTEYYADIAPVLYRRFLSFGRMRNGADLPGWKHDSCKVERASGSSRKVNIDPGYVNGARLVLASTKDHAHRVYVGGGIFAEVTLRYRFKRWVSFDYTFPDFTDSRYYAFLSRVRNRWLEERAASKEDAE